MSTPPESAAVHQARLLHEQMCAAMTAADAEALGGLLGEGYVLTHMTGYRQPRAEWIADVSSLAMQYHGMTDQQIEIEAAEDHAVIDARTLTDATIWGSRGTWRLCLRSRVERRGAGWVFAQTVASTW